MPGSFAITTITNTIPLDDSRQSQVAFTVSNLSRRPLRGRARLVPLTTGGEAWFSLVGEPERTLAVATTEQFVVQINVPPTTPMGSYSFRLDMIGVENPDEEYVQGPTVAFTVPAPAVAVKKPFPWWMVAAGVGVAILLVIAFFVISALNTPAKIKVTLVNQAPITAFLRVQYRQGSARQSFDSDPVSRNQQTVVFLEPNSTNILISIMQEGGTGLANFGFDSPSSECFRIIGNAQFPEVDRIACTQ